MDGETEIDLARFAALSPDLLSIAGTDSYFRWVNDKFPEVLGWSKEELLAQPFLDFVHPDDIAATLREVGRLADGIPTIAFTNRYRCKDGSYRRFQWNCRPEGDTLFAVARDVTEQWRARRAEVEHLRLLRLAEQMAQVGHWRLSLLDNQVTWSEQVYRIHGLEAGDFEPTLSNSTAAYHADDRAYVESVMDDAQQNGQPFDIEARIVRPSGEIRRVDCRGRCELDSEGKTCALFGVLQDVTARKELEARLLQSEHMASLGTLAAGVAHEINNPLSYVIANLDVIEEELATGAPARDVGVALQEARQGACRVRRIVRGLKSFSRVDEVRRCRIPLVESLEAAAAMAGNEVRHRATLVKQYGPAPDVHVDASQLTQVAVNLLVNAAQALPEGGAARAFVHLRCGADDAGNAFFEVEDTGPGIPDDKAQHILKPFFTTKPVGVGTGLGLSIVHGIVTSSGGSLDFESEPGKTVFRVTLPAAEPEEPLVVPGGSDASMPAFHSRAQSGSPGAGTSATCARRVLVVDDDALVRRCISRVLRRTHDVVVAATGEQALSMFADGLEVDAVLLDLMMPGLGGDDVYRLLMREHPKLSTRIAFITGGAFTPESAEFLARATVPTLSKPFDAVNLRALVDDLANPPSESPEAEPPGG